MAAQPESFLGTDGEDSDVQETREWLDALSAVIGAEGAERAHFLLEQLERWHDKPAERVSEHCTLGYRPILAHAIMLGCRDRGLSP